MVDTKEDRLPYNMCPKFINSCGKLLSSRALRVYNNLTIYLEGAAEYGELIVSRRRCMEETGLGKDSYLAACNELIDLGLIKISRTKLGKNVFEILKPKESKLYSLYLEQNLANQERKSLEKKEFCKPRTGCSANADQDVLQNTPYDNNRLDNNRLDKNNTLSKDKGVPKGTLDNLINQIFYPKNNLLGSQVKVSQTEIAKLLAGINKSTHKSESAKLKICLAKVSNSQANWEKVTGQDLAYWYKDVIFPKEYGKAMSGGVQQDKTLFTSWLIPTGEPREVIFYSMYYWKKLYDKLNKGVSDEATLFNLNYKRAKLKILFDTSLNNAQTFIDRGYTDKDIRSTRGNKKGVEKPAVTSNSNSKVLF